MANVKEIQRTERVEILMSKEEKELIWKYAAHLGMKPSRVIRICALHEAETIMKFITIGTVKAYRKYLEIADPKELKRLSELE